MKTYWLGVRNVNNNTDVRGPFTELDDAMKESKFFKPYSEYEFIVFPLRTTDKRRANVEAHKIFSTPALLEDHLFGGWIGYVGKTEYGSFKCRNCEQHCSVWKGSDSYRYQLCAKCLDKAGLGITLRKLS